MGNNVHSVKANIGDDSGKCKDIRLIYTNRELGRGSFGGVHEAELEETGEKVAVKVCNVTRTGESREVKYLKQLKHCNIVDILYHYRNNHGSYTKEYIVMEYMPKSLWKSYNKGISSFQAKLYMYQLLRGLAYMHSKDICHRDVKPENVLLDVRTGIVKLCDFGCSSKLALRNRSQVCTLRYAAPEFLLKFTNFTKAVDVWSAGCVLVELLKGGTRIFSIAFTVTHQRNLVMKYFGTPTEEQFSGMRPSFLFQTLQKREAKPWSEIISPHPPSDDAMSLCSGLLCYSPSSRLLPQEALAHKFFDVLRSPETTCLANGNPLPPLFNFQPGEFPGGSDHLIPHRLNRTEEKDD